jgi:lysine decarboxylase
MCYPPGIPILAPGELVTREALDYILYAKSKGSLVMGPQDMTLENIFVVK